jgi:hypothetical protein
MLRQFSTNPQQNPGDWEGENWRGLGYDVYAFFPEFPPDGDPSNDSFGSEGRVGSPLFDLQVDYQATSEDFWRIVDDYAPIILITTSRGGSIGWELEAIEGGHGEGNNSGPAFDWSSDGYGSEVRPVQASVDARSWQAMTTYRQGTTIGSALPMQAIFDATDGLTVASVEIENGTSGNYLSGFLGLHGLHYNATESHNVAAGHIHVGIDVEVAVARLLLETSLETVIQEHPARSTGCSPIPSDP